MLSKAEARVSDTKSALCQSPAPHPLLLTPFFLQVRTPADRQEGLRLATSTPLCPHVPSWTEGSSSRGSAHHGAISLPETGPVFPRRVSTSHLSSLDLHKSLATGWPHTLSSHPVNHLLLWNHVTLSPGVSGPAGRVGE